MSGEATGGKRDKVAEFRPIARAAEALDKAIERQMEINPAAGFDDDRKVIGDALRAVSVGFSDADRALVCAYALTMRVNRERGKVSTSFLRGLKMEADANASGDDFEDEGPEDGEADSSGGVGGMGGPSVGKGKAPESPGRSVHGRAVEQKGGRR